VVDIAHGTGHSFFDLYVPLINGSQTNFSHPAVLTYPLNAYPTDKPRPQLLTRALEQFSRGGTVNGTVNGGTVNADQEGGGDFGPLSSRTSTRSNMMSSGHRDMNHDNRTD
jgi:hypothetical protein